MLAADTQVSIVCVRNQDMADKKEEIAIPLGFLLNGHPMFNYQGTASAWEAEVMPLYDTRLIRKFYLMWLNGHQMVVDF